MVKDECCFLVCSVCFLVSPRIKCSEMAPPTVIWVLPHQSPNTKRHHRPTCWGVGGHFSVEDPSSQASLICVKLMKMNQLSGDDDGGGNSDVGDGDGGVIAHIANLTGSRITEDTNF